MAIRQEQRKDVPQMEVHETDYGAKFVKAATETKIEDVTDMTDAPVDAEPVVEESPVVEEAPVEAEAPKQKRKGGRPKKQK